jgi:hypothetical protein
MKFGQNVEDKIGKSEEFGFDINLKNCKEYF